MTSPDGTLLELVRRLDSLGTKLTLTQVHAALSAVAVTVADAKPWIRVDPRRYHRGRVALRDAYELLVMTWLPGQSSVPHDHGGSICGMQVVDGTATEMSYCVEGDGRVRPAMQVRVPQGRTISGADSGIHSVHNLDRSGTLVTVHVYAPPLRDFRRFAVHEERPTPVRAERTSIAKVPSVCIIGGGFCGTMVAAGLRRAGFAGRIAIVEKEDARVGRGVAYSPPNSKLLLNVPARNMGAWADNPGDFLTWLNARGESPAPAGRCRGDRAPQPGRKHVVGGRVEARCGTVRHWRAVRL